MIIHLTYANNDYFTSHRKRFAYIDYEGLYYRVSFSGQSTIKVFEGLAKAQKIAKTYVEKED
jgi:hypothetical protein